MKLDGHETDLISLFVLRLTQNRKKKEIWYAHAKNSVEMEFEVLAFSSHAFSLDFFHRNNVFFLLLLVSFTRFEID